MQSLEYLESSPAPEQNPVLPWFALRIRSNFESTSALHLQQRGYEAFLPSYSVTRRWSDRVKQTERLLFPGYLFCRLDLSDRLPVLTTPGVVGLIGFVKNPTPIPEQEIEDVRAVLASGLPALPWPYLCTGQRVRIECGPLAGIEGILTEFKRGFRVVVSVSLLQRSVAAEVDRDCVRPVVNGLLPLPRTQ